MIDTGDTPQYRALEFHRASEMMMIMIWYDDDDNDDDRDDDRDGDKDDDHDDDDEYDDHRDDNT